VKPAPGRLVLLGHPVAQSRSALFQNAALRHARISLEYEPWDVTAETLDDALASLALVNGAGNVTMPHKEAVAARCVRRGALAERTGAVNTFWHEEGELVGDNTDVDGIDFVTAALLGAGRPTATVALIGAGGSAAAVLAAAERWGDARVRLYNRSMDRALRLAQRFENIAIVVSTTEEALCDATLVVNATSIGMRDSAYPVPVERLPSDAAVFDLVYGRIESRWVTAARAAGHRASDGEGMLLEQGAVAFERWFGVAPDRDVMLRAIHA
jgi:shikimate dehydrogenase